MFRGDTSTLSGSDLSTVKYGAGRMPVNGGQLDDSTTTQLLNRLNSIQKLLVESRLSQVPLRAYFYGGLLSTGADPQAPPAEVGGGFTNAILVPASGSNTIGASATVELVRLGTGLTPNTSYPGFPGLTIPQNTPSSLLTYLYPGVIDSTDFSFRTLTMTGDNVVVGSALAIDSDQASAFGAYGNKNNPRADDFDTYEYHRVHSYHGGAGGGIAGTGGITLWDDYNLRYAVQTPWNLSWSVNCRCLLSNFIFQEAINLIEWDLNTTWTPTIKQLTDIVSIYQDFPAQPKALTS